MNGKKLINLFLILLILLLSAFLRFHKIDEQGLLYWDEGLFLNGAKFLRWRVNEIFKIWINKLKMTNLPISPPEDFQGLPVLIWKPFHILILAIYTSINDFKDWSAASLSAIFGLMTILLVYFFGKTLFNNQAGLWSAFFLGISHYHNLYSRIGLHENDSVFFVLLSSFFLIKYFLNEETALERSVSNKGNVLKGGRYLFFSGLSLGAGFGSSYRWIIAIPIIFFLVLTQSFLNKKNSKRILTSLLILFSGFALVFALCEWEYWLLFFPHYINFEPTSYLEALKYKFITEARYDTEYLGYYPFLLYKMEGLLFILLAGLGLVFLILLSAINLKKDDNFFSLNKAEFLADIKRRKSFFIPSSLMIIAFIIIPLSAFSFQSERLARTITIIIPWLCLSAGFFCSICGLLFKRKGLRPLIFALIITLSLYFSLPKNFKLFSHKGSYKKAFEYMKNHNGINHISTMWPISVFYCGKEHSFRLPADFSGVKLAYEQGAKYILIDWEKYVWYYDYVAEIEAKFLPVFAMKNEYVDHFATLRENYLPADIDKLRQIDPTISYIKIYDLNEILIKAKEERKVD